MDGDSLADTLVCSRTPERITLAWPANQKDYNLRMMEWFDTLLRDQPARDWLKVGVPRLKRGSSTDVLVPSRATFSITLMTFI